MLAGVLLSKGGYQQQEKLVVVQGAAIKLYKGLACPLDDFELLLCSLSGPDGMTYPLCPFCYSNPPFEGIQKVSGALPCPGLPCPALPCPALLWQDAWP